MKVMKESEAEDFLEKEGFQVAERQVITSLNELKIKYPIVMKATGLLHKTEKKGIILHITNKQSAEEAFKKLKKISDKIMVHKFQKGRYLIAGLKKDDTFGHVLMFGLGDVFTELLKDVTFRVLPIKRKDILEMIKEIKHYPFLEEFRGDSAVNINLLADNLMKVSDLVKKYPEIEELDINPLVVSDKEAVVADARIVLN